MVSLIPMTPTSLDSLTPMYKNYMTKTIATYRHSLQTIQLTTTVTATATTPSSQSVTTKMYLSPKTSLSYISTPNLGALDTNRMYKSTNPETHSLFRTTTVLAAHNDPDKQHIATLQSTLLASLPIVLNYSDMPQHTIPLSFNPWNQEMFPYSRTWRPLIKPK